MFLLYKKKGQHTFYKLIYFISISRRFPGPPALYSGITQIIDEDIVITWSLYRHLCRGYHSLTKWTHCCQAITHSQAYIQQHEADKKLLFFFSVVGGPVLCGNDHVCHCAAPLCLLFVSASMYEINVNKYLTKLLELLWEKSIYFFLFFLSGRHLATGQMLPQLIF